MLLGLRLQKTEQEHKPFRLSRQALTAPDSRTRQYGAGSHLDFKVLTRETNGGMFVMENMNMSRGGPPRHVHFEQEEWFCLIEGGDVVMEIGEQKLRLKPGDSVLAPRNVPHVWAYIGEQPGRMVIAFSPAAKIESYFEETSKPGAKLNDPQRYEAHGMKLLGPPLLG